MDTEKVASMDDIVKQLPYQNPFLFVDSLTSVSDDAIEGHYTLKEDEFFYRGHFPGNPVTPGVILTEIAAQIGLVSLGIHLIQPSEEKEVVPVFSSANIDFLKPVYPGEKVIVKSKKEYFRFGKLKCSVEMINEADEMVCKGQLSGMVMTKGGEHAR